MTPNLSKLVAKVAANASLPPPVERRAIREQAGCSQDDIAATLNVSRAAVARWENGERTPRGDLLVAYVKVLAALRRAVDDAA